MFFDKVELRQLTVTDLGEEMNIDLWGLDITLSSTTICYWQTLFPEASYIPYQKT